MQLEFRGTTVTEERNVRDLSIRIAKVEHTV